MTAVPRSARPRRRTAAGRRRLTKIERIAASDACLSCGTAATADPDVVVREGGWMEASYLCAECGRSWKCGWSYRFVRMLARGGWVIS
jgi:hypothetical protein